VEYTFSTTSELLVQAIIDDACQEGLNWCAGRDLSRVLQTIPTSWRMWCLSHDYTQFEEHCDWKRIHPCHWPHLLWYRPKYDEKCDWSRLQGRDWAVLLGYRPDLAKHCDWSLLVSCEIVSVLMRHPQLADSYNMSKVSAKDLEWLLKRQPHLVTYKTPVEKRRSLIKVVYEGGYSDEPEKAIRDALAGIGVELVEVHDGDLHGAAKQAFGALVGASAPDDSVQGKARIRLRKALGYNQCDKDTSA